MDFRDVRVSRLGHSGRRPACPSWPECRNKVNVPRWQGVPHPYVPYRTRAVFRPYGPQALSRLKPSCRNRAGALDELSSSTSIQVRFASYHAPPCSGRGERSDVSGLADARRNGVWRRRGTLSGPECFSEASRASRGSGPVCLARSPPHSGVLVHEPDHLAKVGGMSGRLEGMSRISSELQPTIGHAAVPGRGRVPGRTPGHMLPWIL